MAKSPRTSAEELKARANAIGWACSVSIEQDEGDDYVEARLEVPNGRSTRRVLLFDDEITAVVAEPFEEVRFLGNYSAIVRTVTGDIEASLTSGATIGFGNSIPPIWRLPGVEVLDSGQTPENADSDEVRSRPKNWRLIVQDSGAREIELSPGSPLMKAFLGERTTIKLRGFSSSTQDEAIAVLETVAPSYFFDLDARYGIHVSLAARRRPTRRAAVKALESRPEFPRNAYLDAPLTLYQYGRASAGLPLLQYLAFYQALEFFFPMFTREDAAKRLRTELNSPRFDASSDEAVARLIALIGSAVSGQVGEREQIRATVRACIDPDTLRDFVLSSDDYKKHFCAKDQPIKGAPVLQTGQSAPDIRDQVADRVYAIRCRIVHTKQDGGGSGIDLLLPTSSEANALPIDVELVRMLAQRALIARARPLA